MCCRSRVKILPDTSLSLEYESTPLLGALQHTVQRCESSHTKGSPYKQISATDLPILGGDPELPVTHDTPNFLATVLLDAVKKS